MPSSNIDTRRSRCWLNASNVSREVFDFFPSGEGFEGRFLTLASELHENAKWQDLMNELESADSSSPDQLGSADTGDRRSPQLKPSA